MFKGKKGVYSLILINVLVWGFFVYRFYAAFHETDESISSNETHAIKLDEIKDSVGYKLSLNYDDPFLKKEPQKKNYDRSNSNQQSKNTSPKIVAQKQPTVAPIQIPVIKYLGSVKNSTSGIATAIITLNGQSKLVKPNETVDGVLIKSFDNNELNATWGKEKIVARK